MAAAPGQRIRETAAGRPARAAFRSLCACGGFLRSTWEVSMPANRFEVNRWDPTIDCQFPRIFWIRLHAPSWTVLLHGVKHSTLCPVGCRIFSLSILPSPVNRKRARRVCGVQQHPYPPQVARLGPSLEKGAFGTLLNRAGDHQGAQLPAWR